MSTEKIESETGPAADAPDPTTNPYLPDALERIERVRALLDGFPKTPALAPLSRGLRGQARRITVDALLKAIRFAEEQPNVGAGPAAVRKLRDRTDFLLAYEAFREKVYFTLRDLDQILEECKHEAAKTARALYRVGKVYAVSAPDPDQGQVRAQVDILKPVFGRRRVAPKPAPPADPDAPALKKKK